MESLKMVPMVVLILAISGIILGAAAITNSSFGDTMTKCYNSSYILNATTSSHLQGTYCNAGQSKVGTVGVNGLNITSEFYTSLQSGDALGNVAEQQPVLAIISVMIIIISLIAGVFAYMRYFQ